MGKLHYHSTETNSGHVSYRGICNAQDMMKINTCFPIYMAGLVKKKEKKRKEKQVIQSKAIEKYRGASSDIQYRCTPNCPSAQV